MIRVFQKEDLQNMNIHISQAWIKPYLTDEVLNSIEVSQDAYTVVEDGKVIACGGVALTEDGIGKAWAFFSDDAGKYMYKITKMVLKYLPTFREYDKIVASVEDNFEQGNKFMNLVGFTKEKFIENFLPNGASVNMYGRSI